VTEAQREDVNKAIAAELRDWSDEKDGDFVRMVKRLNRAAAIAFNRRPQPSGGNAA
jgi:hypothetical protein